ncbi:MAG: histidine--tRNA ligase [Patescibacteria group bacterium]|nr:histidine--tRNA ligase [Patescibacteria group bacterium]MDE2438367.1 histidine--tRNA ligase [Patescibacteria group bacterium]
MKKKTTTKLKPKSAPKKEIAVKKVKWIPKTARGVKDVLPEDEVLREKVKDIAFEYARYYQYGHIETPIFEDTELFLRAVGEATDIIEKQMYTFKTEGGTKLTLRPEGTAPVARAYIEHGMQNLPQPVKLFYMGPMFRHEAPQRGRLRQLTQFGLEVLGDSSPSYDAEVIVVIFNILKQLKVKDLVVEINSIGDKSCRTVWRNKLKDYYRNKLSKLCKDCKNRYQVNPFRLLDCKEKECIDLRSGAPAMLDNLCSACSTHFKGVLEFLDEMEIPYALSPYLVRGLDYYTRTVFEVFSNPVFFEKQVSAQEVEKIGSGESEEKKGTEISPLALAGGGRYDDLVKLLGGKDTPGLGGAIGVDRVVDCIEGSTSSQRSEAPVKVFLVQLGVIAKRKLMKLREGLRKEKISSAESFGRDSIKAQLKIADRLGAEFVLILGQREVLDETIILRDMHTGSQEVIPLAKIFDEIKRRLKK